jgi:PAS domain-containing protein
MPLREPFEETSITTMQERIRALYRRAGDEAHRNDLLSTAFEELNIALSHLQTLTEQLHDQQEHLLNAQAAQEQECQRYKDLFLQAPSAYVVTSIDGTIRQTNTLASRVFGCPETTLIGRSLSTFLLGQWN